MRRVKEQIAKAGRTLRWLPTYGWQRAARRDGRSANVPVHLVIALADHFEPSFVPGVPSTLAPQDAQRARVERWCREYPQAINRWRDADGKPFRHTYFYPAEQYDEVVLDRLSEHCHDGWGEVEVHLHHGVEAPDTSANTRRALVEFRDTLAKRHGCLSRWDGAGAPRYAFVHGNWALANSANNSCCGVDDELQILADTGCYADLTLPSAPSIAQVPKINSLYECARPLTERAAHREGRDLRRGRTPEIFPIIVQGPLGLNFARRVRGLPIPNIENSAVATDYPPSLHRLQLWRKAAITVAGRPDWVFIKLHCHGMDTRDEPVMLGATIQNFLRDLTEEARREKNLILHFVTAREMVNIILAACDDREGDPGEFRDYRLQLLTPARAA